MVNPGLILAIALAIVHGMTEQIAKQNISFHRSIAPT